MFQKWHCLGFFSGCLIKNMGFKKNVALTFLCLFTFSSAFADDIIKIKNLLSAEYMTLSDAFENDDLVMMFQPDCSVCKAQIPETKCLKSIKFLGTNGSEQGLKNEYIKFKSKAQAYSIDLKTLKSLSPKLQIVTPQFFKIQKTVDGTLRLKNLGFGFKTCKDLQSKMAAK